jgi:hypothetical protein
MRGPTQVVIPSYLLSIPQHIEREYPRQSSHDRHKPRPRSHLQLSGTQSNRPPESHDPGSYEMADPAAEAPARHASPAHNGTISHRSSFAENLRHSPRSQRHPSFTQAAVQELLNHPPAARTGDPRFVGRDWRQIHIGELVHRSDVRWAELDTAVEQATKVRVFQYLGQK